MLGVTLDLLREGTLSVQELNRIAGFMINPFDLVGVAFLSTAGSRISSAVKPAIGGTVIGILVRGILHLIIF